MSVPVLLSACVGLIFLGITSSVSLGVQHSQFLSHTTNVKDIEPNDNKQDLFTKVNQEQYGSNEANGRGNQPGTLIKNYIQKRQTQPEEINDPEEEASEHLVNKRVTQIRGNAEEMGFKSRPGFRSWGGKRSKFMNWGGKRNTFSRWGGKRSKFNNWGGKRTEGTVFNPYESEICKIFADEPETPHSEGNLAGIGKRDLEYPSPYEQGEQVEKFLDYDFLKRDEFQTWAGKRAGKPENPAMDFNRFSKWGGKRKFSNWAGKRGNISPTGPEDTSSSWILRSYVNSVLNLLENEKSMGNKFNTESRLFQDEAKYATTTPFEWEDTR